jgi:Mg-chelatase subunit ChlD
MPFRNAWVWLAVGAIALASAACNPGARRAERRAARDADAAPYQADVEEGLGAAVAILVDTSGSMRERVDGD